MQTAVLVFSLRPCCHGSLTNLASALTATSTTTSTSSYQSSNTMPGARTSFTTVVESILEKLRHSVLLFCASPCPDSSKKLHIDDGILSEELNGNDDIISIYIPFFIFFYHFYYLFVRKHCSTAVEFKSFVEPIMTERSPVYSSARPPVRPPIRSASGLQSACPPAARPAGRVNVRTNTSWKPFTSPDR